LVPAQESSPPDMVGAMEQVLDRGGRVLTVREVTSLDMGAIEDLVLRLSPRSARQRFLSTSTSAGQLYVQALADPLRTMDAAVVESGSHIVGVGSTHPLPDGTVEFAVAVDDDAQGRGIGTVLVEALVTKARQRGVRTMVGTVLGANTQMFDVLGHLGLSYHSVVEDGTADVTLSIAEDPVYAAAHEVRSRVARAAAVRPLLEPAGVAVLGPPAGSRVRPVAPSVRPEVPVVAIRRVDGGYDVPAGAELALIPDGLSDAGTAALACAEAGVRAIALIGSGRDRVGMLRGQGVLDVDVLERIRDAGARVLGPGSEALINTDPLVRLYVGRKGTRVAGGAVAVVTDDARCLEPLRAQLAARGVGVSGIVDIGRGADLGVPDMVDWFGRDPRTEVILVSLRGAAPAVLVRELALVHQALKPVALLTGDVRVGDGAITNNVPEPIRATSLGDLADLAMLLVVGGQPPGRRVAVVTNEPWPVEAGAKPVEAGANRQLARLAMFGPYLTQHSEMRIHFLIPGSTIRGAVLALPPDVTAEQVHDVLETLVEDPGVDAVVIEHSSSPALRKRALWPILGGLPSESSTGRPSPVIVAVDPRWPRRHGAVPVFASVGEALDSLARVCPR
jgi:GNAT superfamily N-acetyltransferase/succinyl-CoA synthetase alpha subunit